MASESIATDPVIIPTTILSMTTRELLITDKKAILEVFSTVILLFLTS
ncbi:Hypothetical protein ACI5QL_03020 [Bacillus velezensis]